MLVTFAATFIPICLTLSASVVSAGNSPPQNVAVVAGHGMNLTCRIYNANNTLMKVSWYFHGKDKQEEIVIFNGKNMNPAFSKFHVDNQTFDLWTNSTTMQDAGRYNCIPPRTKYSADVVVLSAPPACEIQPSPSSEEDSVLPAVEGSEDYSMSCKVQMRRTWTASMRWNTIDGKHLTAGSTVTREESSGLALQTFTLRTPSSDIFPASSNSSLEDRVLFICTISFDRINRTHGTNGLATNIPEYRFEWGSTKFIDQPKTKTSTSTTITTTTTTAPTTTTTKTGNHLPQNVTVVAGHKMTLTCRIYNASNMIEKVSWYFQDEDKQEELLIFNGKQMNQNDFSKFHVDSQTFDLWTDSTTVQDSGRYNCITPRTKFSAYVIVLSSTEKATSTSTKTSNTMTAMTTKSTTVNNGPINAPLKGDNEFVLTSALILSGVLVVFAILVIIVGLVVVLVYRKRRQTLDQDDIDRNLSSGTMRRCTLPRPNSYRESCFSAANLYQDLDDYQMVPILPPSHPPTCIQETQSSAMNAPVYNPNGLIDTYLVPQNRQSK